ncbi:MAG: hypothetical protein Q7T03_03495 [Deltaproteobacteria bacterium]|nr:hypothetical protein [Deltaproteobacteria bacterium]
MNSNKDKLEEALKNWKIGHGLVSGRLVFESIPPEDRPSWAVNVLEFATSFGSVTPEIKTVLEVANNPSKWKDAHHVFSLIRRITLQEENSKEECKKIQLEILYLAENVIKVIYNATNPSDPFDDDSGWWIGSCLRSLVDLINDQNVAEKAWLIFSKGARS